MSHARQIAIVTGGSAGIGRATVLALAHRGYDIGFTYRTRRREAEDLLHCVREDQARAEARFLDVEDSSSILPAMRDLIEELDGIDVLVNNAGANRRQQLLDESIEEWKRTLNINLTAAFLCAQVAAQEMVSQRRGGRIINVTSVLAHTPLAGGGAYCASKAGLELLTRVFALELADHGVMVNSVAPGHTATPMNYPDGVGPDSLDVIPVGRPASPEDIASVIAFLASADAGYVTGSSVTADGGLLLISGPSVLEPSQSPWC